MEKHRSRKNSKQVSEALVLMPAFRPSVGAAVLFSTEESRSALCWRAAISTRGSLLCVRSWGSDPALGHPASALRCKRKKLCGTNQYFRSNLTRKKKNQKNNEGSTTPYKRSWATQWSLSFNRYECTLLKNVLQCFLLHAKP